MRSVALTLLCLMLAWCAACSPAAPQPPLTPQTAERPTGPPAHKRVLILLIDSLMAQPLETLAANGQVPAFSFLMQSGRYRLDLISAFPTMSVTIDSTLLTGTYPDEHGVPGLVWYHPGERRMINYGDGLRVVWKAGLFTWLSDSLYRLNQVHLSPRVTTLFEDLHKQGRTSASINGLIHRGPVQHTLAYPPLISRMAKDRLPDAVRGPDLLGLGILSKTTPDPLPDGPHQQYGFTGEYTTESLIRLIQSGRLPDVTLAYFPDLDMEMHRHGPHHQTGIVQLDRQLARILDAFGGWRQALDQCVFLVLGDSGVTPVLPKRQNSVIDLDRLLSGFRLARLGQPVQPADDVGVAVNGTMTYLYPLSGRVSSTDLANRLAADPRIELVAWREGGEIRVVRPGTGQSMSYRSGGDVIDVFGQRWSIRGDWRTMDLARDAASGRITSGLYPDGLRRLAAALVHAPGVVAATARIGATFYSDGSPTHTGGGNHGAIHRDASLVPLIVATNGPVPPLPTRYLELKPYIMQLAARSNP